MQVENTTRQSSSLNSLRLVNISRTMGHEDHSETVHSEFSDTLARNDPRWLFAARVQVGLNGSKRVGSAHEMDQLVEAGLRMGFSDMHSRAIIGVVEGAQQRNGLDRLAMRELGSITSSAMMSDPELSTRARWITFGVLFAWAFMIAGIMQFV